jgi:hypothetical protein
VLDQNTSDSFDLRLAGHDRIIPIQLITVPTIVVITNLIGVWRLPVLISLGMGSKWNIGRWP